ncbi:MAG: YcdB/YcdC domain-containing protein [Methanoregula sp.]
MNKNPRTLGGAYLPERYKQQIEAKKRRRLIKKIAVICAVIMIIIVVYVVLSGVLVGSLNQYLHTLPESAEPSPETLPVSSSTAFMTTMTGNMTVDVTPAIIIGTSVPARLVSGMLSLNDSIAAVRQDYPESMYTIISVNLTDRFLNSSLYEFRLKKAESSSADPGFPVFIDARTGDPYTPGQESARISADQAKNLVQEIFLIVNPDRIMIKYNNSPDSVKAWIFTVQHDSRTIITGSLDPDTGQITSFSRTISLQGRQADPVLDRSAAQKIADRYIIDRNGAPLPINMSAARYDPLGFPNESVAGQYVFVYNRIVQDIPCDYDGFTISVDSVTGEITEYNRRWTSPDNAFSVAVDPVVERYEAIFSVQQRAQETFPASASGLKIISAEIRWEDMHPPRSIPRPGSISIAWKIQFDDDIIRAKQWPVPATGWVDARTGKILDFYYQH